MNDTVAAAASNFAVKTEVFEGPLELLLELVEKRKLLINDISLAAVTDEYMSMVATMQEKSLPNTAQFVQLAATLLLIKSKSLLPVLELTTDEESAIDDLEERLKLYQIYRDAAATVEQAFGQAIQHERQYVPDTEPLFTTDRFTERDLLADAMQAVLAHLPVIKTPPKVAVQPVISLEEMIERLHKRIEHVRETSLFELLAGEKEPKTVIVGFLAVLESVKQGSILVMQMEQFSDIAIEKDSMQIPKYY